MRTLILLAAATLALAACQKTETDPATKADVAAGEASTGAGGAVTGANDPNPTGAGAMTGAATSDSAADLKSTSPVPTGPTTTPEGGTTIPEGGIAPTAPPPR